MRTALQGNISINPSHAKFFGVVLAILLTGEAGAILLCVFGIIWAGTNVDKGIKALTISFIVFAVNPVLFSHPLSPTVSLLRIVLLLVFAGRTFISNRRPLPMHVKLLCLFVLVVAVISLFASYSLLVSLSKLFQFGLVSISICLAFLNTKYSISYWANWFFTLFAMMLIISLPFYFIPSIGFSKNERGFQGILNHPQAYALFLSPFAALLIGEVVYNARRTAVNIVLLGITIVSIILTQGRTGVLSVITSLAIIVVLVLAFKKSAWRTIARPLREPGILILMMFLAIFLLIKYDKIQQAAMKFLLKSKDNRELAESFAASRGILIEIQIANIEKHPLLGIGFGLPSIQNALVVERDPLFSLPMGASVEKGIAFVAVFEETGLIGGCLFLLFLLSLFKYFIRKAAIPIAWMGVAAIMTNVGEATFFSIGGMGLLIWLLIGLATISNNKAPASKQVALRTSKYDLVHN